MIICQSSNLAKANITLIKEENVNSSFLSHLGSCYNCLYYTKLIFLLKKKTIINKKKKKHHSQNSIQNIKASLMGKQQKLVLQRCKFRLILLFFHEKNTHIHSPLNLEYSINHSNKIQLFCRMIKPRRFGIIAKSYFVFNLKKC